MIHVWDTGVTLKDVKDAGGTLEVDGYIYSIVYVTGRRQRTGELFAAEYVLRCSLEHKDDPAYRDFKRWELVKS